MSKEIQLEPTLVDEAVKRFEQAKPFYTLPHNEHIIQVYDAGDAAWEVWDEDLRNRGIDPSGTMFDKYSPYVQLRVAVEKAIPDYSEIYETRIQTAAHMTDLLKELKSAVPTKPADNLGRAVGKTAIALTYPS